MFDQHRAYSQKEWASCFLPLTLYLPERSLGVGRRLRIWG